MAKIEDLIARIRDEHLRETIAAEVHEIKKTKRFGLVFESHLPESLRLPRLPVHKGCHVARKGESSKEILQVVDIKGKAAICMHESQTASDRATETESIPIKDLVVVKHFGEPIFPSLTPIGRVARGGPDKPWHVLINADNYHALQLLLYTHERKVDVIYIDPPYNSGARDWKYNNDYVDRSDTFRHSKWLAMMQKRLVLARKLLRHDGILICTIDENELNHLAILLDELFPEYLKHMLTIVINPKGTGKLNFGRTEEHALFCIPNTGQNELNGNYVPDLAAKIEEEEPADGDNRAGHAEAKLSPSKADGSWDKPIPREEAHLWELRHARRRGAESSYRHQRKNQFYPLYVDAEKGIVVRSGDSIPLDKDPDFSLADGLTPVWPIDKEGNHRCWRFIPTSMQERIDKKLVVLGKYNKQSKTWTVNIWERKPKKKKVKTVWWHSRHDAGTHGTTLLHNILGRRAAFPFPKSLYAVADTLATVVGDRPDAVILDFFAGSGTTFHAVSLLNARLGGRRSSILVSDNEPGEKQSKILRKFGHLPGDQKYEAYGICESIMWPRCKYVVEGHRDDGTPLPGIYQGTDIDGNVLSMQDGFRENIEYFRLDFLEPARVERGDAFEGVLPVLWLMAGCIGARDTRRGASPWYIAKYSPFAVLIRETHFLDFQKKLKQFDYVTHVFLVTDSEENFMMMRRELGRGFHCLQLYKSYLETFRINAANPALTGEEETKTENEN